MNELNEIDVYDGNVGTEYDEELIDVRHNTSGWDYQGLMGVYNAPDGRLATATDTALDGTELYFVEYNSLSAKFRFESEDGRIVKCYYATGKIEESRR